MPFKLTPPKIKLLEKHVVKACVEMLRWRHYYCKKEHVGHLDTRDGSYVPVGQVGLPDYSTMHEKYPGFFVEFKRPGGKLSEAQKAKHEEITGSFYRLPVVVVDSKEQLEAWLNEHERKAELRFAAPERVARSP